MSGILTFLKEEPWTVGFAVCGFLAAIFIPITSTDFLIGIVAKVLIALLAASIGALVTQFVFKN